MEKKTRVRSKALYDVNTISFDRYCLQELRIS